MPNTKKKCKNCRRFIPADKGIQVNTGFFCSFESAIEYGQGQAQKKRQREQDKQAKAERKRLRERKEALKSRQEWLSDLQVLVNKYVRLRDAVDGCISCDKPSSWDGQWHASHYYSRGHSSGLRFNLWNIHKSCSVCNSHLSGNVGQYTPRLISKIGQDRYDWLTDHKSDICRYDIDYIKRAIKVARKAIRRLEKRSGSFSKR